ncbi:lipoate--protein ligase family protein [bacterium]|nr:lipoate--protein ligase family protein [bacterium]
MEKWRWINTGFAAGSMQMAIDWVLLESVKETEIPVMRIYRWEPFCISMGHNQALSHIDIEKCRQKNVDVVRRPTGGRAVFHAEEVTYSVIVPETNRFAKESVNEFYMLVSNGLARGVRMLDVPAVLEKRGMNLRNHYKKSSLSASCFSAAARYEVVVEGRKLIGSAQRRIRGGLLQHGSILTGDAHLELPFFLRSKSDSEREEMKKQIAAKTISIGTYLGRDVSFEEAGEAVKRGISEEMSVEFTDSGLSGEEFKKAFNLQNTFAVK